MIRRHPIHARDDIGHEPARVAEVIHPDAVQEDPLGDPVRCGTDHAGHGCPSAEAVLAVTTGNVVYDVRPAPELAVGSPDPGINDVHVHPGAR